jgi:hypothetical protein
VNALSMATGTKAWNIGKLPTFGAAWHHRAGHAAYSVSANGRPHYLNYGITAAGRAVTPRAAMHTFTGARYLYKIDGIPIIIQFAR